jgi:hypothetical protein
VPKQGVEPLIVGAQGIRTLVRTEKVLWRRDRGKAVASAPSP